MKLKAPDAATAVAGSPINWFLGIVLTAFLTIISASAAADAQPSEGQRNPAEQWVVDQVTADKVADLNAALNPDHTKKFPEEGDRQLSAHFLEDLLTGTLPDVKLHRHGVQIKGGCIDEPVDLTNAQIPCAVLLGNCQFKANATFASAHFESKVTFNESTFEADASFNSMKVGGDAVFIPAVFEGPVHFTGAEIANNLVAIGAKFQSVANFNRTKVGGDAVFDAAVFGGPVFFTGTDIANNFTAFYVKFQGVASFSRMKVGGDAVFILTVFEGPVHFTGADIANDFFADRAEFKNKQSVASFSRMKVEGNASFNDQRFEGSVDFSYADFAYLDLFRPIWPNVAARLHMQGMTYKYIRAAPEEPESHTALLKLADRSIYTADVYSRLEEYFLRQGYRDDADMAFIAGKRRERQELHGLGWLGSWVFDFLTDYGRKTGRIAAICIFWVALGCVLFSPKKMELQNPEDTPRVYSRFWYSLGLFLPFVNLQADKVWKPKADQTFLRNYMRVHILLGWILVPLVLAALTGLVK